MKELTQEELAAINVRLDRCPRCGEPCRVCMYGWELNYHLDVVCDCTIYYGTEDVEALIEAANRRTPAKGSDDAP